MQPSDTSMRLSCVFWHRDQHDLACCLLKQAGNERVHKRCASGKEQLAREFTRENHVFKECLVYFGWMREEDAGDHGGSYVFVWAV